MPGRISGTNRNLSGENPEDFRVESEMYLCWPLSSHLMKAIIVPGNGNTDITQNWYQHVKKQLEDLGIEVIADNMPDPDLARKEYWLPFIREKLGGDDVILIGHSSGAVAILRYLEEHKCRLAIVVGVYHTCLENEHERKSGYFDDPWQWEKIKKNAGKIIIFASTDDPYISIEEPRYIKEKLDAEYNEYEHEGHFGGTERPEIVEAVRKNM